MNINLYRAILKRCIDLYGPNVTLQEARNQMMVPAANQLELRDFVPYNCDLCGCHVDNCKCGVSPR